MESIRDAIELPFCTGTCFGSLTIQSPRVPFSWAAGMRENAVREGHLLGICARGFGSRPAIT